MSSEHIYTDKESCEPLLALNSLSRLELDEQIPCQLQIGDLSFRSSQLHMEITRKR
jgi:hypothetical protein